MNEPSKPDDASLVENLRVAFERHNGLSPEFVVAAVYHYGRWSQGLRSRPARWLTSKVYGVLSHGVLFTTGCTINREAKIGYRPHFVHIGNIHIHPGTVIGDRVGIMHDVTIGTNMEDDHAPVIGNDVFIGAGAKILGNVTIGDGARVAANTLVISDVPPKATAVGVPARIFKYTGRK